jgi:Sec-independent protein secretion pathway component TatC
MWLLFEIGIIAGRMVKKRQPSDEADA